VLKLRIPVLATSGPAPTILAAKQAEKERKETKRERCRSDKKTKISDE